MADSIIVLDRDGVINIDSPDYIKSAEEWIPLPGSIAAIASLYRTGHKIYVATNQAGLARKRFSLADLEAMHAKLYRLVNEAGGQIERVFYCPHHPDAECECRKPRPGMLQQIRQYHSRPIASLTFVGDSVKDIDAAIAGDCEPVLVLTGNGEATRAVMNQRALAIPVYSDLAAFAKARINAGPSSAR
jgi:D-glycero-D-manno-heptose 1,7-bisphosphate phosphatase